MEDIIVIVGPTGVGKTKLSIELAKKLDAEIINGDSVSIYKKLDIGSAKPSIEERDGVIHHLIDIRDVEDDYNVYDYQKAAKMFWEVNVEQERHLFKVLGFNKELYWNWVMERLYTGRVHDMNGDEIESYYTLQEELEWIAPWVEKKIFKYKYK